MDRIAAPVEQRARRLRSTAATAASIVAASRPSERFGTISNNASVAMRNRTAHASAIAAATSRVRSPARRRAYSRVCAPRPRAASAAPTARTSPERPSSPKTAISGGNGDVAKRRCDGERDAEIGGRFADAQTAGDRSVDVVRAERESRAAFEHGENHREPLLIEVIGEPPRRTVARFADERLHFDRAPAANRRSKRRRTSRSAAACARRGRAPTDWQPRAARSRASKRRRSRRSSRSGSCRRAGCGTRRSSRLRSRAPCRRDARAAAVRRLRRPS